MMTSPLRTVRRRGFTLVEVMVASVVSAIVVGGVMAVFIQALAAWERSSIVGELNLDLELALERIRDDLRLSSVGIGLMSFYPVGDARYTAVSLPLAEDTSNDGLLDRHDDGRIIWNRTVIYHVRPGNPDKLLRTEFRPRKADATPDEIYAQLTAVVLSTDDADIATATLAGEQARTRVVFENLVDLTFFPPDASYDTYAPTRTKGRTFNWGSIVLGGGMNHLTFTVDGKNPDSSGYNIEIDRIRLSHSSSDREGEIFVPKNTRPKAPYFTLETAGMTPSAAERAAGWLYSGNAAMVGTAAGVGATATFYIYNDLWCDSLFNNPGGVLASNCTVKYDASFVTVDPFIPNVVVSMDKGIAWTASSLSGVTASDRLAGQTLHATNTVFGTSEELGSLTRDGKWARFNFQAGNGAPTYLTNVTVRRQGSLDVSAVTFKGGHGGAYVPARETLWSDWVEGFVVDQAHDYEVGLQIGGLGNLNLDLFVGGSAGQILFHENVGTPEGPVYAAGVFPFEGINYGTYSAPAFVDIDNDGDLDLFIGGWSTGNIQFYRNQGTPTQPQFVLEDGDWKGIRHPLSRPTFADIDNDGDYDCFIGGQNGYIQFVPNIGTPDEPVWGPVDTTWKGIRVLRQNNPAFSLHYSAPAFADIDGDGDLDLFVGRYDPGNLVMFENTGTPEEPAFGSVQNPYMGLSVGLSSTPAFADIDNDGDMDLFVGDINGTVTFFENTGTRFAAAWGATNANYLGISAGTWSTPVLANINPDVNSVWRQVVSGTNVSVINGVPSDSLVAREAIEVGFPEEAVYRSGIFDTRMEAPNYRQLNWTHVERAADGGDVAVRVRASNVPDMSDLTDADWRVATFADDGYFPTNEGNNLNTLPRRRYVQYEARLRCTTPEAHTNAPTAILRDVTIDWAAPTGLVDLLVDFGKGPDGGIVTATVNGQAFLKGVSMEIEIYKQGRRRLHRAAGTLEMRPLNTGR